MGGEGPSERGGGRGRLLMEGMGGCREERRGRGGERRGGGPAALLLAWLKHLHACLTQEVLKKERE